MTDLVFEWDERKNRANRKKHGVSFEEARSAFLDENARVIPDPEHSEEEDRFILLGLSASLRILSCATAIGRRSRSYASFPLGKQTERSNVSTVGGSDEETL